MYDIARAANPERAAEYDAKARGYEGDREATRAEAKDLAHRSDTLLEEGERREHRHHILTVGVTMLHVAIAGATIAIIAHGHRWPWHASMALGALGAAVAAYAYAA